MLTFLFLSILLPSAAMLAPILTGPQQPAALQEVNILFYGVMQFASTLSDLYESTTQKLDKIRRSSDFYERGLEELRRQTQRAQQKQEEIREIVEGLEVTVFKLQGQGKDGRQRQPRLKGIALEQSGSHILLVGQQGLNQLYEMLPPPPLLIRQAAMILCFRCLLKTFPF